MISLPFRVNKNLKPYNAAVIGGGITGLTAALRLSENPECSKVTLYEKSSRLGGYVQSETIPIDGGKVVFEYGPRTIRSFVNPIEYHAFLDLVLRLGIKDSMIPIPKFSPAAYNRFIYYPDRLSRVPAPRPFAGLLANFWDIRRSLREPVFKGLLSSILMEPFRSRPRDCPDDESVAEFISRKLSPRVADNLFSAMFHGIFAGDINRLSARSLLGTLYESDETHGSYFRYLLERRRLNTRKVRMANAMTTNVADLGRMEQDKYKTLMRRTSVFTWERGLGQLIDGLVAALSKSPKVEIVTEAGVNGISQDPSSSDLIVSHGQGKSQAHSRVIATNPPPDLARILANPQKAQAIPQNSVNSLKSHDYAVTVMVVNLYYSNPNVLPAHGFGYLIPRSTNNPEHALGVMFASEASMGQDTAPGTKITVMLGGHYWDGWTEADYPDHDEAETLATLLLERHLGIKEAPTLTRTRLQRNAIPQYTVGHEARIREISRSVRADFRNRLTLAGNWYYGVGLVDCITQAYLAASYGVGHFEYIPGGSGHESLDHVQDCEGGVALPPTRYFEIPRQDIS